MMKFIIVIIINYLLSRGSFIKDRIVTGVQAQKIKYQTIRDLISVFQKLKIESSKQVL